MRWLVQSKEPLFVKVGGAITYSSECGADIIVQATLGIGPITYF